MASTHPDPLASIRAELRAHSERLGAVSAADLFAAEPDRYGRHSLMREGVLLDLSRTLIDEQVWQSLLQIPDAIDLATASERLLAGDEVNQSEGRAALHPACRAQAGDGLPQPDAATLQRLQQGQQRMLAFTERLRAGELLGSGGQPITHLINMGAGGSDLGVRMILTAFAGELPDRLRVSCAANAQELRSLLREAEAERTLLLCNSKSFRSVETLDSAAVAIDWLKSHLSDGWQRHLAAVTSVPERALELGVPQDHLFALAPEIGGRFSLWSEAGLAAAATLGAEGYRALLAGARRADGEFLRQPWRDNLVLRLALRDFWHLAGEGCRARAFFPYYLTLSGVLPWAAQLEMESLGKRLAADSQAAVPLSGVPLFGAWGPTAQHSQFQMLYQGQGRIPVELLAVAADPAQDDSYAQCLAQAQALSNAAAEREPWRRTEGQSVSVLVLRQLNPQSLGFLLACWEHRVFALAQMLGINAFDQWGVEHGKRVAERLRQGEWRLDADPATVALADLGRGK